MDAVWFVSCVRRTLESRDYEWTLSVNDDDGAWSLTMVQSRTEPLGRGDDVRRALQAFVDLEMCEMRGGVLVREYVVGEIEYVAGARGY